MLFRSVIAKEMETLVGNNVKALGFTDENMARAVVEYIDGGDAEDIYQIRKGLRR